MQIVNPIYDQVFKYLMDNNVLAKKILSVILEQNVTELSYQSNEAIVQMDKHGMSALRMDFRAIVTTNEDEKQTLIIELQKSKRIDPIIRFRRYLGDAYMKTEIVKNAKGEDIEVAYPIVGIYILGYPIIEYDVPALLINNVVYDAITKKELDKKGDFVKLLTHRSYVLFTKCKHLKTSRKTKLEMFLGLFDRGTKTDNKYIRDIDESEIGDDILLQEIANYLHSPTQDPQFIRKLAIEDEIDDAFEKQDEQIRLLDFMLTQAQSNEIDAKIQADKERKEKEEAQLRENEAKARENEAKARENEAKARENEAKAKLLKAAKKMKDNGIATTEISDITGLSIDEIDKL